MKSDTGQWVQTHRTREGATNTERNRGRERTAGTDSERKTQKE